MEQKSYIFKCSHCGCHDLLMRYECRSVVAYPVTKLVEGDIRKDKHSRTEITHGPETCTGLICANCGWRYESIEDLVAAEAVVKFDV